MERSTWPCLSGEDGDAGLSINMLRAASTLASRARTTATAVTSRRRYAHADSESRFRFTAADVSASPVQRAHDQ